MTDNAQIQNEQATIEFNRQRDSEIQSTLAIVSGGAALATGGSSLLVQGAVQGAIILGGLFLRHVLGHHRVMSSRPARKPVRLRAEYDTNPAARYPIGEVVCDGGTIVWALHKKKANGEEPSNRIDLVIALAEGEVADPKLQEPVFYSDPTITSSADVTVRTDQTVHGINLIETLNGFEMFINGHLVPMVVRNIGDLPSPATTPDHYEPPPGNPFAGSVRAYWNNTITRNTTTDYNQRQDVALLNWSRFYPSDWSDADKNANPTWTLQHRLTGISWVHLIFNFSPNGISWTTPVSRNKAYQTNRPGENVYNRWNELEGKHRLQIGRVPDISFRYRGIKTLPNANLSGNSTTVAPTNAAQVFSFALNKIWGIPAAKIDTTRMATAQTRAGLSEDSNADTTGVATWAAGQNINRGDRRVDTLGWPFPTSTTTLTRAFVATANHHSRVATATVKDNRPAFPSYRFRDKPWVVQEDITIKPFAFNGVIRSDDPPVRIMQAIESVCLGSISYQGGRVFLVVGNHTTGAIPAARQIGAQDLWRAPRVVNNPASTNTFNGTEVIINNCRQSLTDTPIQTPIATDSILAGLDTREIIEKLSNVEYINDFYQAQAFTRARNILHNARKQISLPVHRKKISGLINPGDTIQVNIPSSGIENERYIIDEIALDPSNGYIVNATEQPSTDPWGYSALSRSDWKELEEASDEFSTADFPIPAFTVTRTRNEQNEQLNDITVTLTNLPQERQTYFLETQVKLSVTGTSTNIAAPTYTFASDDTLYTVKTVRDGDTIEVTGGTFTTQNPGIIRFKEINTPETAKGEVAGEHGAEDAKAETENLLLVTGGTNRQVYLLFYDKTEEGAGADNLTTTLPSPAAGQSHPEIDIYGRYVAYVFRKKKGTETADLFLNYRLVREGFARAYDRFEGKYIDTFKDAELAARAESKGLWSFVTILRELADKNVYRIPAQPFSENVSLVFRSRYTAIDFTPGPWSAEATVADVLEDIPIPQDLEVQYKTTETIIFWTNPGGFAHRRTEIEIGTGTTVGSNKIGDTLRIGYPGDHVAKTGLTVSTAHWVRVRFVRVDETKGAWASTTFTTDEQTINPFVFGAFPMVNLYKGVAVSGTTFQLPTATKPDGTALTTPVYSTNPLPTGLTFTAATRTITGTPSAAGSFEIVYTVTAESRTSTERASYQINDELTGADIIFAQGTTDIIVQNGKTTISPSSPMLPQATSRTGGTITYSTAGTIPNWLAVDTSTRAVTIALDASDDPIPVANASGDPLTTFAWIATDANSNTSYILIRVHIKPGIDSEIVFDQFTDPGTLQKNKTIGATEVRFPEAKKGGQALTSPVYSVVGLPTGVTFTAATRYLAGKPTVAGNFEPLLKVVSGSSERYTRPKIAIRDTKASDMYWSQGPRRITGIVGASTITPANIILPEAFGGRGTITYSTDPTPPSWLTVNATTRAVTVTTSSTVAPLSDPNDTTANSFQWVATDEDSNVIRETITVVVKESGLVFEEPTFGPVVKNEAIPTNSVRLPEAKRGNTTVTGATYSIPVGLPSTLTFDATTRYITGTPTASGDIHLYYRVVTSDNENLFQWFVLTILDATTDPIVFGQGTRTIYATIGAKALRPAGTLTLPAATGGTGAKTYTTDPPTLPNWLAVNKTTRVVTIGMDQGNNALAVTRPSSGLQGASFRWIATDTNSQTESILIRVIVEPSEQVDIVFDEPTIPANIVRRTALGSTDFRLPRARRDGTVLAGATYAATGLPAGLSFAAGTRYITGTPTTSGEFTIVYTVTAKSEKAQIRYPIIVHESLIVFDKPMIPVMVKNVSLGSLVFRMPQASRNGTALTEAQATYAIASGDLPAGLAFNEGTRYVAGKPTASGQFLVRYSVTVDSETRTTHIPFSIVETAQDPLSFSAGDTTIRTQVGATTLTPATPVLPQAIGGAGTITYTTSPTQMDSAWPAWLDVNSAANNRQASIKQDAMNNPIAVTAPIHPLAASFLWIATDGNNNKVSTPITVLVEAATVQPVTFGTATIPLMTRGTEITGTNFLLPEASQSGSTLTGVTYSTNPLPAGLMFTAATRAITGTPTSSGSFEIIYTATKGSLVASKRYPITIMEPAATVPTPVKPTGVTNSTNDTPGFWTVKWTTTGTDGYRTQIEVDLRSGTAGSYTWSTTYRATSALGDTEISFPVKAGSTYRFQIRHRNVNNVNGPWFTHTPSP